MAEESPPHGLPAAGAASEGDPDGATRIDLNPLENFAEAPTQISDASGEIDVGLLGDEAPEFTGPTRPVPPARRGEPESQDGLGRLPSSADLPEPVERAAPPFLRAEAVAHGIPAPQAGAGPDSGPAAGDRPPASVPPETLTGQAAPVPMRPPDTLRGTTPSPALAQTLASLEASPTPAPFLPRSFEGSDAGTPPPVAAPGQAADPQPPLWLIAAAFFVAAGIGLGTTVLVSLMIG